MKVNNRKFPAILMAITLSAQLAHTEVRLPQIISSDMVIQRNKEIHVWGWADPREKVTVHFNEQAFSTRAGKDGNWMITLPAMKAGGPYSMKVRGKNIIDLDNILIGDVWICSGQSNMEMSVSRSDNAAMEAMNANYSGIRLFTVANNVQSRPAGDVPEAQWLECTPENVMPFSAVGYFFGREIHKEIKVPVGLISTNWGGTAIETWTSAEAIRTMPDFKEKLEIMENSNLEELADRRREELKSVIKKYAADTPGIQDGRAIWADPDLDMEDWGTMELPGLWEGKTLYGFDGIVWFRFEFRLDEEQASGGITLKLGPIDDSDQTWMNGHKVGEMINSYAEDRIYEVPADYLVEGRNVIAVRVEDTGGGGGIWGKPEDMVMEGEGMMIPLAGEWHYRVSPAGLNLSFQNMIEPNSYPCLLYNGMIHPLLNFPVTGAIWYQGEANADRAYQYRELMPLMINDWRKQWQQPDMPFFMVQLANFMKAPEQPGESNWAELREAQFMASSLSDKGLPKTGIATAIDIGMAEDIHPTNKQDVGKRLALSALKIAYGSDIVYSGPVFKSMRTEGSHVILSFDHTGSGLLCRDKYGYLKGFAVAGEDRVFHWAGAFIKGNEVRVSSQDVANPAAVRYGWADNPDDINLYNQEGLPAFPFRTDDWPGLTMGNR